MIQRQTAVDSGHDDIHPTKSRVLGRVWFVMQVAKMPHTKPGNFKDENGIAIRPHIHCIPEPCAPGIGVNIAHKHIAQIKVVVSSAPLVGPTFQHMGYVRIGKRRPMGRMGIVHGDHVGPEIYVADIPCEIRHRVCAAMRLYQKHRMVDVSDPNTVLHHICAKRRRLDIGQPRHVTGQSNAMGRNAVLRSHRHGEQNEKKNRPTHERQVMQNALRTSETLSSLMPKYLGVRCPAPRGNAPPLIFL